MTKEQLEQKITDKQEQLNTIVQQEREAKEQFDLVTSQRQQQLISNQRSAIALEGSISTLKELLTEL